MKKILSLTMIIAVVAVLAVHAFAADVPQDGLIGHFRLDGDLVNDVTGLSATRLYREFHPLDEESGKYLLRRIMTALTECVIRYIMMATPKYIM